MGNDGADAMVDIRKAGGITIAESEESAIVFGMPGDTIKRGGAQVVAPIWNIAREIMRAVNN
jgi:two-component system chemotaxis response regulator CheB